MTLSRPATAEELRELPRRGRPRTTDRNPKTHRASPDRGTEEVRIKRAMACGLAPYSDISRGHDRQRGWRPGHLVIPARDDSRRLVDTSHAGTVLGRVYALGLLEAGGTGSRRALALFEAGKVYAALHDALYGSPHVAAQIFERVGGPGGGVMLAPSSAMVVAETRCGTRYRRLRAALAACGQRALDVTENVVIYDRVPRFLGDAGRRPDTSRAAGRDRDALLAGLAALAEG